MYITSPDWVQVCRLDDISRQRARIIPAADGNIAIFRTGGDRVFALRNSCPHKQGPLSEGIVHGCQVTCPLHNWVIDLESGHALGADKGSVPVVPVTVDAGIVYLRVSPSPAP